MKKIVFIALFSLLLGSVGTFAGTPKKVETKVTKTEMTAKEKKAPKVQCKFIDKKGKQCKKKTADPSGLCKKHNK